MTPTVNDIVAVAVPAMLFLMFVAVGFDLTIDDFRRLRRQPALVLVGLLAPPAVLPLMALLLARLFGANPDTTLGVMIVAACPAGGISITYSYLARASSALAVSLTTLSCVLAPLTIPAVGLVFRAVAGYSLDLAVPLPTLAGQVALVVTAPVALGLWIRRRAPGFAAAWSASLQRAAFAGVAVVLCLLVLEDPRGFVTAFSASARLAIVFVLGSFGAGWLVASGVARDARDRFTLAAEFGARNVGVATAIAVSFVDRAEAAQFAVTYFLVEIPLMVAVVATFRHRMAPSGAGS